MCVLSMVFDHYEPILPKVVSGNIPTTDPLDLFGLGELRALIAEFRELVEAAKKIDRITGQPDCEDPKKAELEQRVSALEAYIWQLQKHITFTPPEASK